MIFTWAELIEEYMLELTARGFSKSSLKSYRSQLVVIHRYFAEYEIEPLDVKKLHVKKLVIHWQELGRAPVTINKGVVILKGFYRYCCEEEYITVNPCDGIKQQREQKKIVYPLNDTEIKQIIHAASNHSYPLLKHRNAVILMLMLDCGLRIGEVERLNNADILQNQLHIKEAKNRKERAVALSPTMKKALIKYLRVKKQMGLDSEALIVNHQNGRMTKGNIWFIMSQIAKKVKIRDEVRFSGHTLRHTYAAMQVRNGLDIHTLSLNMGHENIGITQTYLRSLSSEDFINKSIQTSTLMNLR
ncbi:tyrosine-type recombinase/integrase [Enterococcus entomosocium]|uniref:tyrosine-type recombinase/integrase n=1 Tax=Enterococcus entomosocium TaxID=3034352 RepID=UPI002648DD9C|nr:tyrosine-type recombinase/integrase [Enterococcus entomosocium]